MNPFLLLGVAIAAELVGTASLKASDGFSKPAPTVVTVVAYLATFYLLAQTIRHLPLGFVYAVWSGIGSAGAAVIGVLVWQERLDGLRLAGIAFVIVGVVLLNLKGAG